RRKRIVGESPLANVSTHAPGGIVGRETRKTHRSRLDQANAGSVRVVLAYRARDNFLIVHLYGAEEMLRQVRAVKAHSLVRIAAVVVVPILQRRRRPPSQLQCKHSQNAADS